MTPNRILPEPGSFDHRTQQARAIAFNARRMGQQITSGRVPAESIDRCTRLVELAVHAASAIYQDPRASVDRPGSPALADEMSIGDDDRVAFAALVEYLAEPLRASGHFADVGQQPADFGPRVTSTVEVRWRKTENGPRWEMRGVYLGTDRDGRHQISLRPAAGTTTVDPEWFSLVITASEGKPFVPRRVREPELQP